MMVFRRYDFGFGTLNSNLSPFKDSAARLTRMVMLSGMVCEYSTHQVPAGRELWASAERSRENVSRTSMALIAFKAVMNAERVFASPSYTRVVDHFGSQ